MPTFKDTKRQLRSWLQNVEWSAQNPLPEKLLELDPKKLIGALLACLPEENSDRAARAFGWAMNRLFTKDTSCAREIMRRLIWQMNEESGNIGWGVPLAFAQALAQNPTLADEYHRILFHYIFDKEGDSTYCDFAPLRCDCYRAIDLVLHARPDLAASALPLLRDAAARDQDPLCRAMAEHSHALAEQLLQNGTARHI